MVKDRSVSWLSNFIESKRLFGPFALLLSLMFWLSGNDIVPLRVESGYLKIESVRICSLNVLSNTCDTSLSTFLIVKENKKKNTTEIKR